MSQASDDALEGSECVPLPSCFPLHRCARHELNISTLPCTEKGFLELLVRNGIICREDEDSSRYEDLPFRKV